MHRDARRGRTRDRWKRPLDLIGAILLLVLSAPLVGLAALLIRLDSDGPVVFKARRVGRDGEIFTLYKFRTMSTDAEARLSELRSRNLGGARFIRIPDDPRVTRVGRALRASGLDELPQLANVIRGEMSLVGPRPQAPNEVALYTEEQRRRLQVRPGVTGLWQVRAWGTDSFDDWVRYDLQYIGRRSLWLDLRILGETPWALFRRLRPRGRGAARPAYSRREERHGAN